MANNILNVLKIALDNYDKTKIEQDQMFKIANNISFNLSYNDIKKSTFKLHDKKKEFEILSVYNTNKTTWSWAWELQNLPKNMYTKSLQLHNYGMSQINSNETNLAFIRKILISHEITMTNPIDFDVILALSLYLTKSKYIVKIMLSEHEYAKFLKNIEDGTSAFDIALLSRNILLNAANQTTKKVGEMLFVDLSSWFVYLLI